MDIRDSPGSIHTPGERPRCLAVHLLNPDRMRPPSLAGQKASVLSADAAPRRGGEQLQRMQRELPNEHSIEI